MAGCAWKDLQPASPPLPAAPGDKGVSRDADSVECSTETIGSRCDPLTGFAWIGPNRGEFQGYDCEIRTDAPLRGSYGAHLRHVGPVFLGLCQQLQREYE